MKRCSLVLLLHFFSFINSNAQDINYAVNLISPELLKNANAVKRMDETKVVITGIGKAIIYHQYAITILNAAGDINAGFHDYYDKFRSIESIEGKLFNADGKSIRTMKKSELVDISLVPNSNLIDDYRGKIFDFESKIYPYTVEFEYSIELKGLFFLPEWEPVAHEKFSVQNSGLSVECPASYKLRYKVFNYNKEPLVVEKDNNKIYKWNVEKIPAIEEDEYSPAWYELVPTVFLAPSDFEIAGYKGNMDTWKNFGAFIYTLNQGRDQLPENIKEQVHTLTDGLKDVHQKIKILYQYLQKNTHYISVQLGIGGWQPFDAGYVAKNGYGDCKALSNYMYSLLKEAGIKSYYTLINAGEYNTDFINDFSFNHFNHIIVCVPLKNDTTWLECTSQTLSAGYLSSFTNNRYGLLIDEMGGTLVHTPDYGKNDNLQLRHITASIDSAGTLNAKAETKYIALKQDQLHYLLNGLSKEKLSEHLKNSLNLPSYDIVDFDYKEGNGALPSINETLDIVANNYAAVSGRRIFIQPNILSRSGDKFNDYQKRICDIVLKAEYKDIDSVEITIPAGYKAESIPDSINLASEFGNYSSSLKVVPGEIIYYRKIERNSGRFPASDAKLLADFFEKIYKADRSKVVLVKNN
jgi:hypothetical protein